MMSDDNCPPGNQPETDYNAAWSQDSISWSTITFNLDDPEGERRMRECLDAPKWKSAVWEFDDWMKRQIKHGAVGYQDEANATPEEVLAVAREHLHILFSEHGIDIWEE